MNRWEKLRKKIQHLRQILPDRFARQLDKITGMGPRNMIATGIMVCGAAVILYAVIIPFYNKYQNDKMVDIYKQAMAELTSMEGEGLELSAEEHGGYQGTGLTEEQYNGLSEDEKARLRAQLEKEKTIRETLAKMNMIGIIRIDALNLEYAVVEGTNREDIRASVGHISTTAPIGGDGNCVIAGHRGGYYGEFFKNIHKLQEGDLIYITDANGKEYTYSVYAQKTVKPKDWTITDMVVGERTLTLLSCEDSGTKRIAVIARMVEITKDEKTGEQKITVVTSTTTPSPSPTPEPTPVPTPTPAPTPSPNPIQDVTIYNEAFGEVIYTGKTDENGDWNTTLPNGTYKVIIKDSNGEEVVSQLVVGDGVTSFVCEILVNNEAGQTVYTGKTDENGNYNISTDGWPGGYYTFVFTDVFGRSTQRTEYIEQTRTQTQYSD